MFDSNTALIGVPALAGAGALGWWGWNRYQERQFQKALAGELARRKGILGDAAAMRPLDATWMKAHGHGQIASLWSGSFAAGMLPFVVREFERAGALSYLGPAYVIELDKSSKEASLGALTPDFKPKVVHASCDTFSIGMSGAPIKNVLRDSAEWETDVEAGARQWLSRVQRESDPGLLLVFLSPGGSAGLGWPVCKLWYERYGDKKPIYIATILDEKTPVRRQFPQIREVYSQHHLTRGYIVMDNRRFSRRSDTGIAVFFAADAAARWISDRPLDPWNGLAYMFPADAPGQAATISVFADTLPNYYLAPWREVLPEVFYSKAALLEEKLRRGIQTLATHPELQSVPLEAAELGSTRLCVAAAPVVPKPDLQVAARRVVESLESWRQLTDPDLSIQIGSVATPMGPLTEEVPLFVVLMQRIHEVAAVDALALGAPVDAKFLPAPDIQYQEMAKLGRRQEQVIPSQEQGDVA